MRNSLDTLDGAIPVSLILHFSSTKPITVVTHTDEVLLKYKTVCFINWIKLDGRIGLACVIYEVGAEKPTFQHRIKDHFSVIQA